MFDPWQVVRDFERALAEHTGAPCAVAVDSCCAAILLCARLLRVEEVCVPRRTYPGVPAAILWAGGRVRFSDDTWQGVYQLAPYPLWDCALRFRRGMYVPGQIQCLSFHSRKILPIGRGGAILTDDPRAADALRQLRYCGRHEKPLMDDTISLVGLNLYMDPSRAGRGMELLQHVAADAPDQVSEYPDCAEMPAFRDAHRGIWKAVE